MLRSDTYPAPDDTPRKLAPEVEAAFHAEMIRLLRAKHGGHWEWRPDEGSAQTVTNSG